MMGACCPAKSRVRSITVGGQTVGISQLDEILRAAEGLENQSEEAVKEFLIQQLKIYNYIPPGTEDEYLAAVWKEYLRVRNTSREAKG